MKITETHSTNFRNKQLDVKKKKKSTSYDVIKSTALTEAFMKFKP